MRLIDTARRSGRSLLTAKGRTILTALAIGVGGFTLTLTLAASNGAREYADRLIASNFDKSELIVAKDNELFNNSGNSKPQEYDETVANIGGPGGGFQLQFKRLTLEDIEKLRANPDIEQVREEYQVTIQYVTRGPESKKYTGNVNAYNPAQKPETKAGNLPSGSSLADDQVLLPDVYLESLGFKNESEAIGQTITIVARQSARQADVARLVEQVQAGQLPDVTQAPVFESLSATYTIAAVTKRPATSLSFGLPSLLIGSNEAKRLSEFTTKNTPDYQKFAVVNARVKGGTDDVKRERVKQDLINQGFAVQSVQDAQKTLTQIVTILQSIVTVFGVITLIAAVFGIINTQYISVLERTREIGLMKALGMRNRDVRRLFMIEATWIGFLGGLIGVLAGLVLGLPLNPLITKQLELGTGNHLLIYEPLQLIVLIAGLMLIATTAGYLPARKAARLDPIEALRTE